VYYKKSVYRGLSVLTLILGLFDTDTRSLFGTDTRSLLTLIL
jgi:hypothetical protein